MKSIATLVSRWTAVALVATLAGCETSTPQIQYPEITFTHLKPIRLDVVDIDYVPQYASPRTRPNVEHEFPVPPAQVVERWSKDRLEPVGISRRARVVLLDASVKEVLLQKRTGLTGFFYNDQAERYDATVEVRLEIVDDEGNSEAHVQAVAQRSRTVPEDITLSERDQLWFELTEDVMKDLDAELERTIRRYLIRYVR
jgi:hypothetical protein